MNEKKYIGTVYIGVVGPDNESGVARDSIERIIRRSGDSQVNWIRATKGYEARQMHLDKFMESNFDFILLLDHDMVFAPDTLERLRSHMMPYVSGYYMRRRINPIVPVYFDRFDGNWPMRPATGIADRDSLTEIGASGWGCILLHRDVVNAMKPILKGEQEIIEDDMDVWPYDLEGMMKAINNLKAAESIKDARPHIAYLEQEFRPLRGKNDVVGSDIRFPFYAKEAGFALYLDASVRPAHQLQYALSPDDFDNSEGMQQDAFDDLNTQVDNSRKENKKRLKGLRDAH